MSKRRQGPFGGPRKGKGPNPTQPRGYEPPTQQQVLAKMMEAYVDLDYVKKTITTALAIHMAVVYDIKSTTAQGIVGQFVDGFVEATTKARNTDPQGSEQSSTGESPQTGDQP